MPDTLTMKILTVVSMAIVIVDLEVLRKTFIEYIQLRQVLESEPYQQCYKPQAHLRIVFQCYAIYAALVCTTLTSMLALKCTDAFVETVARMIINLCFLVFGPILLTFVNYGFVHFKQLAFVCTPRGPSHRVNFLDIILLLICFILAICVTFTMAMQKTLDMAQQSFQDENSLIYRLASLYFSYQVRQSQERDRQQLRQRQEERREQRRQRQAEREQILTAFQNQHPHVCLPTAGSQRTPSGSYPQQQNGASSQASTIAMNVPQRTLDNGTGRINNRAANYMQVPRDSQEMNVPLQTMNSSQNDNRDLLDEDLDEEMHGNFQVIPQRATDYEYVNNQEDKQNQNLKNLMPEAQIINQYKSLNQQFQQQNELSATNANNIASNHAMIDHIAKTGSFHMHDNGRQANTQNQTLENNLYMKNEEQKEQELPHVQLTSEHDEDVDNNADGEQLIKDTKTSSGVSISQASTNMQTIGNSQISSMGGGGAAVASTSLNINDNSGPSQRPSVGAVPPSNQRNEGHQKSDSGNLDQRSDVAFQSLDGASVKPNNSQKREKDD